MRKTPIILILIFSFFKADIHAQSRFMVGFNAGGNISRVYVIDSLPQNFSRRNRTGFNAGIQTTYDLKKFATLSLGINYINKGYKINNDTLGSNPSVVNKFHTLSIPLGFIFKQQMSTSSYFHEKAGLIGNLSMRKDSITTYNSNSTKQFRVTDIMENKFYPMFYLGIGIGGKTENGDRYEFNITYNQSFSTDANLRIEYGQNYIKKYPLSYRGGFVQIGFSYYINLGNFKKSDEYFID